MMSSQTTAHQGALELHSSFPGTACLDCARAAAARDRAIIDAENAEVALRVERRKVKALQKELEQRQLHHVKAADAETVFLYWRDVCKHPQAKLGTRRRKAITSRLDDGYSVADLQLACDGAAADHYVSDKGKHFDDLELICRDEVKVEDFMERGRRARAAAAAASKPDPLVTLARALQVISHGLTEDDYGALRSKCPACRGHFDDPIYRPVVIDATGALCQLCGADDDRLRQAIKQQADALLDYGEDDA